MISNRTEVIPTVVFIHGLSENSEIWKDWVLYFQQKRYKCYAPDYPYHDGKPIELRKNINYNLRKLDLNAVVKHYVYFLDSIQEENVVLIGHSMGGLVVQKLIALGKAKLGICIASAPPKGIFTLKWSFIRSNLPTINPFKGNSVFLGSKRWFNYAITNMLSKEESDSIYDKVMVPESRNIPRTSTGRQGKIDFNKAHAPLLFVGAQNDNIVPVILNIKNHKAYKHKSSIADIKIFPNRCHFICGQQGWEDVAKYIDEWITKNHD